MSAPSPPMSATPTTVPELLWRLAREEHTGTLVLERQGVTKALMLRDGRLVYDGPTTGIDVDRLVRTEDPAGEHDGESH